MDNSNPDKVISFIRRDEESVLVAINSSNEKQSCQIDDFVPHNSILKKGVKYTENNGKLSIELKPYGYALI